VKLFGDEYPDNRDSLFDHLKVDDDGYPFDRDIPVAIGRAISDKYCGSDEFLGVSCGDGVDYAARFFEGISGGNKIVPEQASITSDGMNIGEAENEGVREDVISYVEDNPNRKVTSSRDLREDGYDSLANHTAIHFWYAQDYRLRDDVARFMDESHARITAITLFNKTDETIESYVDKDGGNPLSNFPPILSRTLEPDHFIVRAFKTHETPRIAYGIDGEDAFDIQSIDGVLTRDRTPERNDSKIREFVEDGSDIDLLAD